MRKFICDFCGKESKSKGYVRVSCMEEALVPYAHTKREFAYADYCEVCAPGVEAIIDAAFKAANIRLTPHPNNESKTSGS